jgi:hypothetical protein
MKSLEDIGAHMDATEKLKTGDVAKIAAGPWRTPAQNVSRLNYWREIGVIPTDGQEWGPGGFATIYPSGTGAIAAIMFDLFDAGIVAGKKQLSDLWRFFAEPHAEGVRPHIVHILDAVAAGECCFLVMTMWRHASSGETQPTCSTRFQDEYDKPIVAPSSHHEPVAEYVINLHVLLKRFASRETNVHPFKAVQ